MKFGLMFFASNGEEVKEKKYHLIIESARFGDQHEFSSIWVPERHFTKFGHLFPNPSILHAALARETKRIKLHAGSVVLALHDPIRVAEEWAMVDNLSNGRVGISFAAGWNPVDFAFAPEKYNNRHEELFKAIPIVQNIWKGESIEVLSGSGERVRVRIFPEPLQKELPVWITASGSPQTFIKAGEMGTNLLTHALDQDIDKLASNIALYRSARSTAGYDADAGEVTVMLHTFIGKNINTIREQARIPYCEYLKSNIGLIKSLAYSRGHQLDIDSMSENSINDLTNYLFEKYAFSRGLIGTPDSCMELLDNLHSIGVTEIACLLDFGQGTDLILEHLPFLEELKDQYEDSIKNRTITRKPINKQDPAESNHKNLQENGKPENIVEEVISKCKEKITGDEFHKQLKDLHADFNADFKNIETIWRTDGEALGEISNSYFEENGEKISFNAAFINACTQVTVAALPDEWLAEQRNERFVPSGIKKIKFLKKEGNKIWSRAVIRSTVTGRCDLIESDITIWNKEGKLLGEILGFKMKRDTSENVYQNNPYYRIGWEVKKQHSAERVIKNKQAGWIIFNDTEGIGKKIQEILIAEGETCFTIAYSKTAHKEEQANKESIHEKINKIIDANSFEQWNIIHLFSLDATFLSEMTLTQLQKDQELIVGSALDLIQAIAAINFTDPPRVWFVTRGAQSIGPTESVSVSQAPLLGFARVISEEYPKILTTLIDFERESPLDEITEHLLAEIKNPDRENMIAYRSNERHLARLTRSMMHVKDEAPLNFSAHATYLITGGAGGIGLKLAHWMIERGARYLVLSGRSASSDIQKEAIDQLEKEGVCIKYLACDITDEAATSELISHIEQSMPVLKGIFHLAGLPDTNFIFQQTWENFLKVRAAKMEGSWNLHFLTQHIPLDYFVLFSSAASMLPLSGQSNYASANAFLDALAHYRRSLNKPALSINWGPWDEVGHISFAHLRTTYDRFASIGIMPIPPVFAIRCLEHLLQQNAVNEGVVIANWSRFLRSLPGASGSPLLSELTKKVQAGIQLPIRKDHVLHNIQNEKPENRLDKLVDYMQKLIADTLETDPGKIDIMYPFNKIGLDSLMAIELRDKIKFELHVDINVVSFLKNITIKELAAEILEKIVYVQPLLTNAEANSANDTDHGKKTDTEEAKELLVRIDDLSGEELDTLFKETFKND